MCIYYTHLNVYVKSNVVFFLATRKKEAYNDHIPVLRGVIMPFKYKIDILEALKAAGYSTYRIRKEKIFAEGTLQNFRDGVIVAQGTLEKLCELLDCQPGDILLYEKENAKE